MRPSIVYELPRKDTLRTTLPIAIRAIALLLALSAAALLTAACGDDNPAGATPDAKPGGSADASMNPDARPETEVVCEQLPAITTGVCTVTPGDARKLLKGDVLAPGQVFRGGQVAVDAGGQITCVGCNCAQGGETVVTCPQGVISPGLINTHDHITFAQNPPYVNSGERYEHRHDWRKGQRGHTKIPAAGGANASQISWGELRFLFGGATSTVGSGGQAGLLRNLDRANFNENLPAKAVRYETFPLDDSSGAQRTGDCNYGSMPDTQATIAGDDAYEPHVAEGIDNESRNEFLCVSSTTYDTTAPGVSNDVTVAKTAMIHAIGLTATDYGTMANAGTALIWSPRSNITLYGDTAAVTTAATMGVEIALGTDWTATGSISLLRELACVDSLNKNYYNNFFTDRQMWKMVTESAASVTGTSAFLGSLATGKIADITIFDGRTNPSFRAVIKAESKDVALVMRAGKVLFGEASTVAAVPGTSACDAIDVCGNAKSACLMSEIGKSYADLKAAQGAGFYPDFFCGQPENEPSCVPSRTTAVNGSSIYTGVASADDSDGDGVANATDNCPMVFNPIRPMDNGMQANADNDPQGDVCDVCPIDANTPSCMPIDPNDSDRDGIPNATDNCPQAANPDQADGDGDGKGNVCDPCPTTANPGSAGCTASIYDIKTGVVAQGAPVRVENALVTGKGNNGFYLQVKEGDGGYAGADNSGVFVFVGTNSPLLASAVVGTRVTVDGSVGVFQTALQISGVSAVTVINATVETAPAPIAVTLAEVKSGGTRTDALESVIVSTPGGAVSALDGMFIEFTMTSGADSLQVDDYLFAVTPTPVIGQTFTNVTGILAKRQMMPKLEPRNAADVVGAASTTVLTQFTPATAFVRQGQNAASTTPTALAVTLSAPAIADTFVAVTTSDAAALTVVGGGATVAAGQSSAPVLVNGLAQANAVTLTATLGAVSLTSTVRVLGIAEQPATVVLSPATASIAAGGTVSYTVTLDIPTPTGGSSVTLAVVPSTAGTLPSIVAVAAGQTQATFTYTDASVATSATVTATFAASSSNSVVTVAAVTAAHLVINEVDYDQNAGDILEFVEIKNPTNADISLSAFTSHLGPQQRRGDWCRGLHTIHG
jgi:large repetitive protein